MFQYFKQEDGSLENLNILLQDKSTLLWGQQFKKQWDHMDIDTLEAVITVKHHVIDYKYVDFFEFSFFFSLKKKDFNR